MFDFSSFYICNCVLILFVVAILRTQDLCDFSRCGRHLCTVISANKATPIDQGEGESEALGGMLYGEMLSMVIFYGDILKLPSLLTFSQLSRFTVCRVQKRDLG